jgi:hypothetical protein
VSSSPAIPHSTSCRTSSAESAQSGHIFGLPFIFSIRPKYFGKYSGTKIASGWSDHSSDSTAGPQIAAEAALADEPPKLDATSEARIASWGERFLWGLVLTPLAGSLGAALLSLLRLVIPGRVEPFLDSGGRHGWLVLALFFPFAPLIGGVLAAPVTLLVLPLARWWRPGRDKVSLLLVALAGLIGGFLSPPLIPIGLQSPVWFGMGAGSGLIVAVLYFYLTDDTRRAVLRSAVFGMLSLYVVFPIGASVWNNFLAPKPPSDLGDLNLDDLIRTKRLHLPFKGVVIDPYASIPITIYHRPSDPWAPPVFESTFSVPPRLLKDLFVRWMAPDGRFAVGGIQTEALLPDLTLRTPGNFEQFHRKKQEHYEHVVTDEDVLEVLIGAVASGIDWSRRRVSCNEPNLEADPAFPGLSISPKDRPSQRGIGVWLACQPEDKLPDGHNLLIECYKNPFTHAFDEQCTVGLVLPWDFYGRDIAMARIHGGSGIIASFGFPARRLPEWRRMRDLSLCLIEAAAPSIREPDYPSRNAALCAQIKQAIVERRDVLVESSAH